MSATAVAVAVVLVSIVTFVGARRQVMGQIDESLLARAGSVENLRPGALLAVVAIESGELTPNPIVRPRPGDFDASYYQIVFPDGREVNIGGEDDLVLPHPPESDLTAGQTMLRSVRVDDLHLRVATIVRPQSDVVVQIARPLTEADTTLTRLALGLFTLGAAGVAIAAGLGMIVATYAVKPITDLTGAIGDIADDRAFTGRVEVIGDGEVAALAMEFNTLLDELESAKEQQVRLVRDAGHELRTPLTALKTNIETLQRHAVDPDDRAEMLSAAGAEVEELESLVAEVVDLATDRYEEETAQRIQLGDLVASVAERLAKRHGREIAVSADESSVTGKRQALERAVSNIVGNALKFSSEDGPVAVEVADGTVTVTDRGSGIDEHDLPHVFERFYRSDTARTEPGSGLGLSIVQQIIEDHGGKAFARNQADGGAEIGFTLPMLQPDT